MSPDRRPASLPPAPVLEAELARDWERLLGVAAVARDDDFYDLGGESMAAVELLALVERRYGVALAMDALLPGLTVAGLARRLARAGAEAGAAAGPRSPLVPLQPAGARPPLVCVHPSGGSVLCYLDLARRLGPEQPFYGLQGPDPRSTDEPHQSIETMAAAYLAPLRDAWPREPYSLGGYSFGGYVAFEMARQLVAAGEEPPLVALLDTRAPAAVRPRGEQPEGGLIADLAAVLERHSLEDEPPSPEEERRLWDDLAGLARRHLASAAGPRRPSCMGAIQRFFREHRLLPAGDEIGYADVRRYLRILRANLRCSRAYAPAPYPGRVVLFQAAERLTAAEPTPDDHAAGWSALAAGGLEVRRVQGHHLSLLAPPAVDALARELAVCLGRPVASKPDSSGAFLP